MTIDLVDLNTLEIVGNATLNIPFLHPPYTVMAMPYSSNLDIDYTDIVIWTLRENKYFNMFVFDKDLNVIDAGRISLAFPETNVLSHTASFSKLENNGFIFLKIGQKDGLYSDSGISKFTNYYGITEARTPKNIIYTAGTFFWYNSTLISEGIFTDSLFGTYNNYLIHTRTKGVQGDLQMDTPTFQNTFSVEDNFEIISLEIGRFDKSVFGIGSRTISLLHPIQGQFHRIWDLYIPSPSKRIQSFYIGEYHIFLFDELMNVHKFDALYLNQERFLAYPEPAFYFDSIVKPVPGQDILLSAAISYSEENERISFQVKYVNMSSMEWIEGPNMQFTDLFYDFIPLDIDPKHKMGYFLELYDRNTLLRKRDLSDPNLRIVVERVATESFEPCEFIFKVVSSSNYLFVGCGCVFYVFETHTLTLHASR